MLRLGVPEWNIRVLESLNRRIKLGLTTEVNSQVRLLTGQAANSFSRFAEDQAAFWK
jgi:hypothetical protein